MRHTEYQGKTVAYRVEGKGEPVVLIHGFCEDSRVWEDFKFDLIEEHYRVVMVDLPGFGKSAALAEPSIDHYAGAVWAILDHLGIERSVVIGHSMGGYTALAMLDQQPDRILGMGLFHSHPYPDSPEKQADRLKQVEFIERMGHQLYVKQLVPKLFSPRYVQSNPFDIDKIVHRAARFQAVGITGGLHAMITRPDRSHVLEQARQPILFIVGQLDEAVPPDLSAAQLALPRVASIHVLPKVSHMGMFEARRPTQLVVRQFVDFCLNFAA
ncbi:MAG: alpha/beta fold hydrolase [Lewinella sp.]|nr:alpha/beta fold hydrolase [Lewinella sp.]